MKQGIAFLALALFSFAGCQRTTGTTTDEAPVLDTEIMAFLSEARAFHHQANVREESGDIAGAAATMQRLVAARRPHQDTRAKTPEVEEVLADAYARLAELELRQNKLDAANAALVSGLEHAPDTTYFRGHLVEIQAVVEESRYRSLADAGKTDEAARATEKAIQLSEEAIRIQDLVIRRLDAGVKDGNKR